MSDDKKKKKKKKDKEEKSEKDNDEKQSQFFDNSQPTIMIAPSDYVPVFHVDIDKAMAPAEKSDSSSSPKDNVPSSELLASATTLVTPAPRSLCLMRPCVASAAHSPSCVSRPPAANPPPWK